MNTENTEFNLSKDLDTRTIGEFIINNYSLVNQYEPLTIDNIEYEYHFNKDTYIVEIYGKTIHEFRDRYKNFFICTKFINNINYDVFNIKMKLEYLKHEQHNKDYILATFSVYDIISIEKGNLLDSNIIKIPNSNNIIKL